MSSVFLFKEHGLVLPFETFEGVSNGKGNPLLIGKLHSKGKTYNVTLTGVSKDQVNAAEDQRLDIQRLACSIIATTFEGQTNVDPMSIFLNDQSDVRQLIGGKTDALGYFNKTQDTGILSSFVNNYPDTIKDLTAYQTAPGSITIQVALRSIDELIKNKGDGERTGIGVTYDDDGKDEKGGIAPENHTSTLPPFEGKIEEGDAEPDTTEESVDTVIQTENGIPVVEDYASGEESDYDSDEESDYDSEEETGVATGAMRKCIEIEDGGRGKKSVNFGTQTDEAVQNDMNILWNVLPFRDGFPVDEEEDTQLYIKHLFDERSADDRIPVTDEDEIADNDPVEIETVPGPLPPDEDPVNDIEISIPDKVPDFGRVVNLCATLTGATTGLWIGGLSESLLLRTAQVAASLFVAYSAEKFVFSEDSRIGLGLDEWLIKQSEKEGKVHRFISVAGPAASRFALNCLGSFFIGSAINGATQQLSIKDPLDADKTVTATDEAPHGEMQGDGQHGAPSGPETDQVETETASIEEPLQVLKDEVTNSPADKPSFEESSTVVVGSSKPSNATQGFQLAPNYPMITLGKVVQKVANASIPNLQSELVSEDLAGRFSDFSFLDAVETLKEVGGEVLQEAQENTKNIFVRIYEWHSSLVLRRAKDQVEQRGRGY